MKRILGAFLALMMVFQMGCSSTKLVSTGKTSYEEKGVSIVDRGNYFDVVLDLSSGMTHRQMGEAFAKGILNLVPDYEALIDSYIAETTPEFVYPGALSRVNDIKAQLEQGYRDEIEGMASVFSGGENNVRKDNRISKDELYVFNLFPDVARGTQCCFVSVVGPRSSTNKNITGRNLDWFGGSKNQLPKIQSVITLKYTDAKVCSIGYMGYMGILTAFNDSKVYAAILDSQSGAPYSSTGKRSYPFDIRFALENKKTLNEAAEFIKGHASEYTVNHLITFADSTESKILENNFSGTGTDGQKVRCDFRNADSRLNDGVTWGIKNAVGCVNSFLLYGNYDNHTKAEVNTKRWENIKTQLQGKGDAVTHEEMREIMSFDNGSPGTFLDSGDLYNRLTLYSVIFEPDSLTLEVFFRPKNIRENPDEPAYVKVPVFSR